MTRGEENVEERISRDAFVRCFFPFLLLTSCRSNSMREILLD